MRMAEANVDRSGWSTAAIVLIGLVLVFIQTQFPVISSTIWNKFMEMITGAEFVATIIGTYNFF